MTAANVYVVDACRTPIGRHRGALSDVRPDDLAAARPARRCSNATRPVPPDAINDVVMGAANQAGEDNRNVARMAVLLAGLPMSVPGATVNRLCGSGLDAVNRAAADLALGHGEIAVAGGVEAMSRAPFVLPRADRSVAAHRRSWSTPRSAGGWSTRRCRPSTRSASAMTAEVLAAEYEIGRDGAGRVRPGQPPQGGGRPGIRPVRCELVPVRVGDARGHRGRGPPRRHQPRAAGEAQAGVRHRRHGHRRQLQPAQRRGGGGAARQRARASPGTG